MNKFTLVQSWDESLWREDYADSHRGDTLLGRFPSVEAAKEAADGGMGEVGVKHEEGAHPETYIAYSLQVREIPEWAVDNYDSIPFGQCADESILAECSERGRWE